MPGRNGISAGVLANPAPGALASATFPVRQASTIPGTPPPPRTQCSSGSRPSSSMRLATPSMRRRPASVFKNKRRSRTVRSAASTSGKSEQARFVGVFEIRRMPESRGEENHIRHFAAPREERLQRAAFEIEKRAEPGDPQCFKLVGKQARRDIAVFQHLAESARGAGVVAEDRPATVGRAHEVAAGGDDEAPADRLHAAGVLEKCRTGVHQIRRDQAFLEQLLRAVKVGEHRVDQAHPLRQSGRDVSPVRRWNQQWNGVQFVGLTRPRRRRCRR